MDFFEKQQRAITGNDTVFKSSKRSYLGRTCYITLSGDRLARLNFITSEIHEQYDCFEIAILDKNRGLIDKLMLRFKDIFAAQRVGNDGTKVTPYIWIYAGVASWYKAPTSLEIKKLAQTAHDYIALFT